MLAEFKKWKEALNVIILGEGLLISEGNCGIAHNIMDFIYIAMRERVSRTISAQWPFHLLCMLSREMIFVSLGHAHYD